MIRKLAHLAPLAFLGLAACNDTPAALTRAQEGDCFVMAGKEAGGAPRWEKAECATAGAVTAPIEVAEEVPSPDAATEESTAASTAAAAACPTQPVVCPSVAAAPAPARVVRASNRRAERRSDRRVQTRTRVEQRESVELGQYPRVHTPDYPPQPPLLGGPPPHFDRGPVIHPPAPMPPPMAHGRRDQHAYGYSQRYEERRYESHGHEARRLPPPPPPIAPPPPPPTYYEHREYSEGGRKGGQRYGYREEHSSREYERRSYSSSSSSTSSSSRYGGGYATGGQGCCERPVMAPMNGPHFPVDQDGFLTWRGKTR